MKHLHTEDTNTVSSPSKHDLEAGITTSCDGCGSGRFALQASGHSKPAALIGDTLFRQGRKAAHGRTTGQEEAALMEVEPPLRAGAGKLDATASIRTFRSLVPTLPSLEPLFHKVVSRASSSTISGDSAVPLGTPIFEAFPPAIFFVDFDPAGVYEAVFRLRNKDRFSRRVQPVAPDSVHFSVASLKEGQTSTGVRQF